MIAAVFHILGVLLALAVVILVSGIIDSYFSQRRLERTLDIASVKLNVPRQSLRAGHHNAQISRYLADRYDADQLSNRISDVGRPAFLALEWFSYSAQLTVVIVAGYLAFTNDLSYAPFAWFALVIAVVLWALNVVASALLYVITGRVPGEARDARDLSVQLQKSNGMSPKNSSSES